MWKTAGASGIRSSAVVDFYYGDPGFRQLEPGPALAAPARQSTLGCVRGLGPPCNRRLEPDKLSRIPDGDAVMRGCVGLSLPQPHFACSRCRNKMREAVACGPERLA